MSLISLFWIVTTILLLYVLAGTTRGLVINIATLITRDDDRAMNWASWIFWPGVIIHEVAHWLTAIFFVFPIVLFTVWPERVKGGGIIFGQVGYVKPRQFFPIRSSLIGIAPLFLGVIAITIISQFVFQADFISTRQIVSTPQAIMTAFQNLSFTPENRIWLYLLFAIGNSMMPSASDRQDWRMSGIIGLVLLVVLIYFGIQGLFFQAIGSFLTQVSGFVLLAFAITIVIDIVAIPILWFIHILLESTLGYPQ